jgi:hypothetical protein
MEAVRASDHITRINAVNSPHTITNAPMIFQVSSSRRPSGRLWSGLYMVILTTTVPAPEPLTFEAELCFDSVGTFRSGTSSRRAPQGQSKPTGPVELRRAAKLLDQFAEPGVKLGNGHRPERDFPLRRLTNDCVFDEIEDDLDTRRIRNQGRRQSACSDVEGHVPRMIDPRCPCEPILADDLAIQLERGTGLLPLKAAATQRHKLTSLSVELTGFHEVVSRHDTRGSDFLSEGFF